MHLGRAPVEVAPSFRLYLVTRLANPTYLPEASTLVNLVNFAITRQVRAQRDGMQLNAAFTSAN